MENKNYLVLMENGNFKTVKEENYENTYQLLSQNVGGYIERVGYIKALEEKGIDLWINEEGKLFDLLPTVAVENKGELVDVLPGNLVFARCDDEGRTLPLSDEDIQFIKKMFTSQRGIIEYTNGFTGTPLMNIVSIVSYN